MLVFCMLLLFTFAIHLTFSLTFKITAMQTGHDMVCHNHIMPRLHGSDVIDVIMVWAE